jgi:hypothetical protein
LGAADHGRLIVRLSGGCNHHILLFGGTLLHEIAPNNDFWRRSSRLIENPF